MVLRKGCMEGDTYMALAWVWLLFNNDMGFPEEHRLAWNSGVVFW